MKQGIENLNGPASGKPEGTAGEGGVREWRPPDPPPVAREEGGQPNIKKSYAEATTGRSALFPTVALPRRQPLNKDGKPAIVFTAAEIAACSKQMEHALIAKFSNGRPHVSIVEKEFRSTWRLEGPMTVSDLDGRHILVILESEKDVITALTQAPRRVGTSLFRLFKWTPEFHLRKESTIITIWIRFPRLRPDLFNEGVLRCLCQPFGQFLDSDSHTKQRTRCAFARCCVEIDITKTLPHELWIDTGDGNGWWQEIVYEGNLKYCSKCRLHGHELSECRKMRLRPQERKESPELKAQSQVEHGGRRTESDRMLSKSQNAGQEWILVQGKKGNALKKQQEKEQGKEEQGSQNVEINPRVEEGEIEVISDSDSEPEMIQRRILSRKSNSATNIKDQDRKEKANLRETLSRSLSMTNLEENCTEGKLEFLKDDFKQMHQVYNHLQRTKEENLARLKLMEARQNQGHNYDSDIQQGVAEQSQEDLRSIIPETQTCSTQQGKKGEVSQKKKKNTQSGKKPLTRAAKKHLSPRK